MNPENIQNEQALNGSERSQGNRVESIGFYTFLVSVALSPIVFWPSSYIALDTVKTVIIGLGVIISAIFLGLNAVKEKKLVLPPKTIFWTSLLVVASLIVSALVSIHADKSLFGQGFESNTVSFIATLFLGALVAFALVQKRLERAVVLYVGIFASYFIIFLYHGLRLLFGVKFASFAIFQSQASGMLGSWFNIGTFSLVIALISLCAIVFLSLSKRMKIVYWLLMILGVIVAFVVNNTYAWGAAFLVLLGLTVFLSIKRIRSQNFGFVGALKYIAWLPLIACVIAGVFYLKGATMVAPVSKALNISYSETSLPWQYTLDVTSGAIKYNPMFGIGTNHFSDAYLNWKPDAVNQTDAWNIEFTTGFGLIPTLIAEQGFVGSILWTLFFIFLGVIGANVMKKLNDDPSLRFIVISSYISSVFLWLITLVSVPSHVILFMTFIMTGIFVGASINGGAIKPLSILPKTGFRSKLLIVGLIMAIIIALLWGVIYVKKVVALSYFGAGVKHLTVQNDPDLAMASFASAYNVDHLDVYLQGKVEAGIAKANIIGAAVTKATNEKNTSSREILTKQFADVLNASLTDARAAIAYDRSDYYNYLSEARVSELANSLKMQNAYDNATTAYTQAINLSPKNPSIYLSLAKLEVGQEKLDDAMKALGAALQVKSNYLDAVFVLSQVYAAKGDLGNAIIAGKFATELNPQNAQVFFQLGLLQYNNKDYESAVQSFATSTLLQKDYANAQYFLGLSYARVGKTTEAIDQFTSLSTSNPDNQEVLTILKNLNAGKSIFNDPQAVSSPEKRPALPIKSTK
jgi:tetratricopeptide (TPR) repeat protein